MAFKDVKAGLKAAKDAVSKEEYKDVLRICEAVFEMDKSCYMACIFTGLAYQKLGNTASSKQYYRKAIELQPNEKLGWKGLADFYDKQKPTVAQEMADAVVAYKKLLEYVDTDLEKKYLTWTKLASLEGKLGNVHEALMYYHLSVESQHATTDLWSEVVEYLCSITEEELELMSTAVTVTMAAASIGIEAKTKLRERSILKLHRVYKARQARDETLESKIQRECQDCLVDGPSYSVMHVLASLSIDSTVPRLRPSGEVVIPGDACELFMKLYTSVATSNSTDLDGIACLGQTLVCIANGNWKEAKELVKRVSSLCEGRLAAAHVYFHFHDNSTALVHLQEGRGMIRGVPTFLRETYDNLFQLYQAACYIDMKSQKSVAVVLPSLTKMAEMCTDADVCALLVQAYVLLGRLEEAQVVIGRLSEALGSDSSFLWSLKGEILYGRKEYSAALECWNLALKKKPSCGKYHLLKGIVLWEMPSSDKLEAYGAFLEAAKLDPNDATAFLYIGHYQRLVGRDLVRAVRCYEKALGLNPCSAETLLQLGDAFFATGNIDTAYSIYTKLSADPGPFFKQLWMKIGLYHRRKGEDTAAIQCFQNILVTDPQDRHCWECLGEAYMSRGSLNSALDAFTEVLKLQPHLLNTLYQIANIKRIQGLFFEAVVEYTAVLELESSYVPALKGRGESSLAIAVSALKDGFNGRAVDHISFALKDLTKAAWLRPQFVCIWKLIGDCCTCLYDLDKEGFGVAVPAVLVDATSTAECGSRVIQKLDIFLIAKRAYGRTVQLNPDVSLHWHDLAISHYYLGKLTGNVEYLQTALQLMQKAVTFGSSYLHWIGLGVIAKALSNLALTQHAFIRSIQLEPNNVVAWSNLGALYLEESNAELAHEAFKYAQSSDPTYVPAWIGQAMIAEMIGHNETMDLFRHAAELAYHPEGAVGYGYWVCHTLQTLDRKLILESDGISLNVAAQRGVLQARDGLDKCVRSRHKEPCAYNYLGLLYEQEGLLKSAMMAFFSALEMLKGQAETDPQVVAVKFNCARVQSALGRHVEAEALYYSLASTADVIGKLDMALALLRASKLQDSIQMYQLLSDSQEMVANRSTLYTGAAMASYLQGQESCKEFLFKAFKTSPPSFYGLVTLAVLGTINSDQALVQATAVEIQRIMEWDSSAANMLHSYCMLALKCVHFSLKDGSQAKEKESCNAIASVISKLPPCSLPPLFPHVNFLVSMELDTLNVCSSSMAEAQKMVHMYPSNVCYLGALVYWLRNCSYELKEKYKAVVMLHATAILSVGNYDVKHHILQRTVPKLKQTVSVM